MRNKLHHRHFTGALLQLPWLTPLRNHYHGFDDWFLQKTQSQTPLWHGLDDTGQLAALLYTKKSHRISLSPGAFLAHPDGYLKIGMICASQSNQGWGRFCVAHSIDLARQLQVHAIYATFLPEITAASALFSRCGFSPVGEKCVKGQLHRVVLLRTPEKHPARRK